MNRKISILGHRGIPANYGGFETLAEKITPYFVSRGWQVRNYCRSYLYPKKVRLKEYQGSELVYLPCIRDKNLETLSHTFLSALHLLFHRTEYALVLNVGNAWFALLLKFFGVKVVLNVDGLEWKRKKWGLPAKIFFKLSSMLAPYACDVLLTDADHIKKYYKEKYKADSVMIPYGGDFSENYPDEAEILKKYKLEPKKYFIYIARFEPENNPLLVRQAYEASESQYPLVMVGDAPYAEKYIKQVKNTKNPKVIFTGYVYGKETAVLQKNALAYIRASEVGGIFPAVVQAVAYGTCVLANNGPMNREVLQSYGMLYRLCSEELSKKIIQISAEPAQAIRIGQEAKEMARQKYSWQKIATEYVDLFEKFKN